MERSIPLRFRSEIVSGKFRGMLPRAAECVVLDVSSCLSEDGRLQEWLDSRNPLLSLRRSKVALLLLLRGEYLLTTSSEIEHGFWAVARGWETGWWSIGRLWYQCWRASREAFCTTYIQRLYWRSLQNVTHRMSFGVQLSRWPFFWKGFDQLINLEA